ncbi:PARN like, ribonuclease domain containing 1 [Phyllostomus discolor]|uniref:PARN like, ribonuclease domain containing 1 n=1 Tax=Phyllostomus discolor TaxID=89673 RepID=A0A834AQ55_9CHIR|nr:PARN like, ribonuclease domain containing 1 [Phyllostomus discolor]
MRGGACSSRVGCLPLFTDPQGQTECWKEPSLKPGPSQSFKNSCGFFSLCLLFSNRYVAHSYNFFLFPTTFGILDSEFSFQASSVQFLNQYGFDYNKFLKNGIPYMNEEQEKKIKHSILTGNWRVRSSLDKDQIKVVIDEVTRWLALAEEGDCMTLPGITGFQAFTVQLVLKQALPGIQAVRTDHGVTVKKVGKQHRWYLAGASCDGEGRWKEKLLLSARGFSVFFQMLVKAQKPLVGHNMMMDLLHLHEKFFRPLPESYHQFKRNIHRLFPVLIDTKNVTKDIWKELNFPRVSNLSEVYEVLNSDLNPTKNSGPVIIHASECEKYAETKYPHEAAYDAFLSGSVLLKVAHLLLWRVHSAGPAPEPSFALCLEALAPYLNQVNLIRAGVPKIVSSLRCAVPPSRGCAGRQPCSLGHPRGLLEPPKPKLVIFFLVFPPKPTWAHSFLASPSLPHPQTEPLLPCLSGVSSPVGRQQERWESPPVLLPVFQNFSGPDYPSVRPPVLLLSVSRWPGVSEEQVYREFQNLCKFDVRRLTRNQFLLLTNKFKDARSVLKEHRGHPTLRVALYRHWRHSPDVSCLLQVCGVMTTWALLAFLLGRPSSP